MRNREKRDLSSINLTEVPFDLWRGSRVGNKTIFSLQNRNSVLAARKGKKCVRNDGEKNRLPGDATRLERDRTRTVVRELRRGRG